MYDAGIVRLIQRRIVCVNQNEYYCGKYTTNERYMKRMGDNIRSLRDARKWSQSDLEQRSGISRAQISRIERGKEQNPTIKTLVALCTAFGVTVDEITFGEPSNAHTSYLMKALDELKDSDKEIARQMLRGWIMVCQSEAMR